MGAQKRWRENTRGSYSVSSTGYTPGHGFVLGDFNEVLGFDEKQGGCTQPSTQIYAFSAALEDCNSIDMGCRGPGVTWKNGQMDMKRSDWIDMWPLVFGGMCSRRQQYFIVISGDRITSCSILFSPLAKGDTMLKKRRRKKRDWL